MRLLALTAATLSLAISLTFAGIGPGHAIANLPVCAQKYGPDEGLRCDFQSYEQCRAEVRGLAASCIDNPYLRSDLNPISAGSRARR